jgi:glycerate kinase
VYLLGLCLFQAFIAGAVNEVLDVIGEDGVEEGADAAAESLGDGAPELVEEALREGLSRILSGVGEKFLGSTAKKAAEGMANWFFLRRIGRQAMWLLQPLT